MTISTTCLSMNKTINELHSKVVGNSENYSTKISSTKCAFRVTHKITETRMDP